MVLQHGFLGGSGYWLPQLGGLGRHFDVVAPDLPGFAGSADLPAPGSVPEFAAQLVGLWDRLGLGRLHLIGHSMGGMIALQVALDYPDRIDRLVLYGTACSGSLPERFESVDDSIARIEREGIAKCADFIVPTWFVEGEAAPYFQLCKQAGAGADSASAARSLRALSQWSVCDRLGEVNMPVLVICGDRDRSTAPNHSWRLWRELNRSSLCVVPGCAHNVHLERPELFNAIVLDFLSGETPIANR